MVVHAEKLRHVSPASSDRQAVLSIGNLPMPTLNATTILGFRSLVKTYGNCMTFEPLAIVSLMMSPPGPAAVG